MVHGKAKSRHKTQSARIKSRGCCWSDVISIIEESSLQLINSLVFLSENFEQQAVQVSRHLGRLALWLKYSTSFSWLSI